MEIVLKKNLVITVDTFKAFHTPIHFNTISMPLMNIIHVLKSIDRKRIVFEEKITSPQGSHLTSNNFGA